MNEVRRPVGSRDRYCPAMSGYVDAHVHFWDPSVLSYDWLADVGLDRRLALDEYRAATADDPPERYVFVQAGAADADGAAEAAWVEKMCSDRSGVRGHGRVGAGRPRARGDAHPTRHPRRGWGHHCGRGAPVDPGRPPGSVQPARLHVRRGGLGRPRPRVRRFASFPVTSPTRSSWPAVRTRPGSSSTTSPSPTSPEAPSATTCSGGRGSSPSPRTRTSGAS